LVHRTTIKISWYDISKEGKLTAFRPEYKPVAKRGWAIICIEVYHGGGDARRISFATKGSQEETDRRPRDLDISLRRGEDVGI
jgi:hypothetical protein